jgi:hypothetical protein
VFVSSYLTTFAERYDLHKDINESRRELEHEKAYTQRTMRRRREQHSTLNKLGLSEVEAVEYALMLSREEEEHRRFSPAIDEGVFPRDSEDEIVLPIASSSLPTHGFPSPSTNQSSSSLSDHHSRTYPRAARPVTNEKVQVSPVFVPEPMEAGVTISPLRISTSLPGSSTVTLPVIVPSGSSSHEHFPLISSSLSSSSGRFIASSPEHARSAWNTPLRSAPSPSPSPSSHGSSPHVDTPTLGRSSVSLSSASIDVHYGQSEEEHLGPDEMDDDLKFVIELSLAEARSRGEI